MSLIIFFFNDTATTEIYTLSLHDALPILIAFGLDAHQLGQQHADPFAHLFEIGYHDRSEEHTSELQSRQYLVCRLLLEKKKKSGRHMSVIRVATTAVGLFFSRTAHQALRH